MVRLTKIYTKTGDEGYTATVSDKHLNKSHPRIKTLSAVDTLNATVALALATIHPAPSLQQLTPSMLRIQQQLFDCGTMLAVKPEDRREDTPGVKDDDVALLEEEIDAMNAELAPLMSFILPPGQDVLARLHLARTHCRQAECELASLNDIEKVDAPLLQYLNRLSDWFFVAARYAAKHLGFEESLWQQKNRPSSALI